MHGYLCRKETLKIRNKFETTEIFCGSFYHSDFGAKFDFEQSFLNKKPNRAH